MTADTRAPDELILRQYRVRGFAQTHARESGGGGRSRGARNGLRPIFLFLRIVAPEQAVKRRPADPERARRLIAIAAVRAQYLLEPLGRDFLRDGPGTGPGHLGRRSSRTAAGGGELKIA